MNGTEIPKAPPPRLLSMQEARERLGGVSAQTVRRIAAEGEFEVVKVRRRSFITAADIDAFIARAAQPRLAREPGPAAHEQLGGQRTVRPAGDGPTDTGDLERPKEIQ
jgi:hypothetical protein